MEITTAALALMSFVLGVVLVTLWRKSGATSETQLPQQVQELQQTLQKMQVEEAKDWAVLKQEVNRLLQGQEVMAREAQELSQALRGDKAWQGQWGEIILERLLESAGLVRGQEFFVQGEGLGLKYESGASAKPDVVVQLPGKRLVMIDSKVTLESYLDWSEAQEPEAKEATCRAFLGNMKRHLDELIKRSYHQLGGDEIMPFTIMFVPSEGAYALLMQEGFELVNRAWEKGIVVSGPSSLMSILRTCAQLWRSEKQNRHTEEIVKLGGLVFDQAARLLNDLEQTQHHLSKAQHGLEEARRHLQSGPTSLQERLRRLKEYGVKTTRSLPDDSV